MKLVSYEINTPLEPRVRIGALDDAGKIVDLELAHRRVLEDAGATDSAAERVAAALFPSMVAFIQGGQMVLEAARHALQWTQDHGGKDAGQPIWHEPAGVKILAPVLRPPLLRDFMAFESHLKNIYPRLGREIPSEWYEFPVYYKGNPSSFGGDGDDVAVPAYEEQLDFEFELAFVIGKSGININKGDAFDHVFGMMIYNDFSARVFQGREMAVGLGPAKGKDFQGGHVFGPCLVTMDEIPDPYALTMTARVNGEVWCDDSSGSMHWKIENMIAHASCGERLEAGEVFGTGTVGWGSAAERGTALKRGDVVELEVSGLGTLRNRVV
ncbi:MAG: fumarylacetoacetate hydrolase family protein [Chloroflexota bacterium]|nr:fumarylacetoacetate hydrolase family protein [Chloroflexota bacterium]